MSARQDQSDAASPPPDEIRRCLARLLAAGALKSSPQRRRLLEYVVEQTLAGRADRLKAFELAVAVLGRDERFDPQNDPIVRVEMGRLRRELEHYYAAEGQDDAVRIGIPKGGYVPTFLAAEAPAPPAPPAPANARPSSRSALALGLAALLVAVSGALAAWLARPAGSPAESTEPVAQARGPSILVVPFRGLDGGEGAELLAAGLTNQLVADLMGVEALRVYSGTVPDGLDPAATPAVAFRVEGTVQREAARIRVGAHLLDGTTGEVLWGETFDRQASAANVLAVQDELATGIAERLALPNGAIAVAAERSAGSRPATMFAFDCVQRAFLYRRKSDGLDRAAVLACLDEAVAREPRYANAWAMKSFLHVDGGRLGLVPPAAVAAEFAASRMAAERALELAPDSILSLQALANVRYNEGAFAEAERLQREAIALSPRNPEALAQLGWRLWARGRLGEGVDLLREAIGRSWRSPTWYHQTLALALYLHGQLQPAYDEAVLGQGFCCGLGKATLAVTSASLGRAEEAKAALTGALDQSPLLARDPRAFWRAWHVDEGLIDRLVAGLQQAKVGAF